MATNGFLPFATGSSPNVIDDATYSALTARGTGFQSGVAQSQQLNKVWRQGSVMAAVLGQIIADSGVNASDSDAVATLAANLLSALYTSPTLTGDPKAPTPATSDNDTSIATTAFVKAVVASYLTSAAAATTYAPINNPTFTGNPLAPTPAQFDADTSLATTEFVKRAQGSLSNASSVSSATTLNATHAGSQISLQSGSGTYTVTLPAASAFPAGACVSFFNINNSYTHNVARAGSDLIWVSGTTITALALGPGDTLTLASNGSNGWYPVSGSAQLPYSTSGASIGVGQTWQDVSASRAINTNYTNSTGKPIAISIVRNGLNYVTTQILVNGVVAARASVDQYGGEEQMFCIIPNGATYQVATSNAPGYWRELR